MWSKDETFHMLHRSGYPVLRKHKNRRERNPFSKSVQISRHGDSAMLLLAAVALEDVRVDVKHLREFAQYTLAVLGMVNRINAIDGGHWGWLGMEKPDP